MQNELRNLHLLTSKGAVTLMGTLQVPALRKKYPGRHVALVRPTEVEQVLAAGTFDEVLSLDLSFVQKCAFSPLHGDDTAFHFFQRALEPVTSLRWERVFNLGGGSLDAAIAAILEAGATVGARAEGVRMECAEPTLKLARILETWGVSDPRCHAWLAAKALGQLEWTVTERSFARVGEVKAAKPDSPFKTIVVGWDAGATDSAERERLARLFTLLDLEGADPALRLFVDFTYGGESGGGAWEARLTATDVDPDVLPDRLAELLPLAMRKWICLSFLFDYLGNAKLALAAEKILGRYEREALGPFLLQEVLSLRDFSKALLGGARRIGEESAEELESLWQNHRGTLAFVSAVELSLQPGLAPLVRGERDVQAVRQRLRSLNHFYERVHRATTLEIPKTDLALTL